MTSSRVVSRVVIDARYVGDTLHGMARYTLLMAKGLSELKLSYTPVFLVQPGMAGKFSGFETREVSTPFLNPRELVEIPRVLNEIRADLYHSPTFSSLAYCPCPSVVTIHDLNHLTYGGLKEKLYYLLLLKRFARSSKKVLTVSQFSRGEIADWLEMSQDKIRVVYNAIDSELAEPISDSEIAQVLGKYQLVKGGYFFCLSNPKPHKNVELLVEAFQKFRLENDRIPLVLSMNEFAERPGVKALGGFSDRETRALIAGSKALFFPSLYEGFGLPPVEAAVVGIPVVVSDISAHREALQDLAADEAIWIDPSDTELWTQAMLRASRGELGATRPETRRAILTRYAVSRLGIEMNEVYREFLM